MTAIFLKLLNMSIAAGWLVLAVILLRLLLRRAPKALHCVLWALVAVRLLCPFSLESALSLIPSAETVPPEILSSPAPEVHTGVPAVNHAVNPAITGAYAPAAEAGVSPMQTAAEIAAWIWAIGVAVFLLYAFISFIRIRGRVQTAVRVEDRVWQSEQVGSPFILGVLRPRIYLPFGMDEARRTYVLAHERAHLARRDHWWKPLGFALLAVYWFNPLMWAAYILLCRDIELACDEKVVRDMDAGEKKAYSEALLVCSIPRHLIAACPLAFGEVGVKERVKSVLNYRKPAFWLVAVSVIACAVVAVCFLTNPKAYLAEIQVDNRLYLRQEPDAEALPEGSYELGMLRGIQHRTKVHPKEDFHAVNLDAKYTGNTIYQSGEEADVIYLEDLSGFYIPFKTELKDGDSPPTATPIVEADAPVKWIYSPAMSATWHAAFHFTFDMEYSHIEATCDHGRLWDLDAPGQPQARSLRFEAGSPVCWYPSEEENSIVAAERATVHFTVYDGGEILYTGDLEISSTGMADTGTSYQACLTGDDLLSLQQAPANAGGIVSLSDSASMVSWSDLNHNRTNELVFVREVVSGQLYELVVRENGETIWTMEAGLPHVGWTTILLYSEDGQDYLVQYCPAMFQGVGNYTCTVFSIEDGRQKVKQELSVEFQLQQGDPVTVEETPEMTQFAQAVDLLMRNSAVLLSTEQGILVDEYTQAAALPQLYPVRFNPDEIQAAIDGKGPEKALTASAVRFPEAPVEFLFASGAGAWGTVLTLNPDGSFTGSYSDSEMGDNAPEYPHGTYYVCGFQGRFTDIQQSSDTVFSMRLESVTTEKPEGETWIEDNIRYIASEPYGLTGGADFLLCAPGTLADDLPAGCRDWWPDAWLWRSGEAEALDGWALCNVDEGFGFYEHRSITEAATPLTEEEIAQVNEAFGPMVYDKQENPIGVTPWSCFFTSYYDDVRQMDFEEFLRYFPGDGSKVSDAEFEALKSVDVWPFQQVETMDKMPVPIHKYPSRLINQVLGEYAGITLDDLDTSKVAYLAEYDAYYNYTSDFGPGIFVCTRGEVEGDTVRLYRDGKFRDGRDWTVLLTLRKDGDQYRVVSHQKIKG